MYTVYIVRCSDHTLYTGIARDVAARILEHNGSPKAARYTRGRRPVVLVYEESAASRSEAQAREAYLKRLPKQEKEALIRAHRIAV